MPFVELQVGCVRLTHNSSVYGSSLVLASYLMWILSQDTFSFGEKCHLSTGAEGQREVDP